MIATSASRKRQISKGCVLWRSQVGEYAGPIHAGDLDNKDQPFALLPERMTPLKDRALEGRANPKGIPYLYLATDRETAVAESRAGRSAPISVGSFEVHRDLCVVDCSVSTTGSHPIYLEEPAPRKRTEAVWNDIDRAFSQPINRTDDSADYVPTQILAELFKHNGFDGIVFRSSLSVGRNVVVFDIDVASLTSCCLYEITKMNVEFKQAGNPYVVEGKKIKWNTIELVAPRNE